MKKTKIKVFGEVQGVFFRQSAQEKAGELGVSCEANNLEDGTVEIIVSPRPPDAEPLGDVGGGETNNISKFIDWCRKGSKYAEVEKIEIIELDDQIVS